MRAVLGPSTEGASPKNDASVIRMIPLYHESHFTFRFGDDRVIPRFHLEGVDVGRPVAVFKIDADTDERLSQLATAIVGDGGWVDLMAPIIVKAGDAFIAVLEPCQSPNGEA
jgi:hypothetical protein